MSALASLARELNANWDQHLAAEAEWDATYQSLEAEKRAALAKRDQAQQSAFKEARSLLIAAQKEMRPEVFEIWAALTLRRPLHSIRECLAAASAVKDGWAQ
jgi:hypothetical protein